LLQLAAANAWGMREQQQQMGPMGKTNFNAENGTKTKKHSGHPL
jgi:hypothetical protein